MSSDPMDTEETLSEQTEANNVSSKPVEGVETIAEAMETEEMSEQIETKKMSEQIEKENISEQNQTVNMSGQIETEKFSFCHPVERGEMLLESVETEQMFSKQPDADKMSKKVDNDVEGRDLKCILCDVCKANPGDQTTQFTIIASQHCLECEQNLCDRCLRFHKKHNLRDLHIEDIRPTCHIENNAAEPSHSKVDNIVEQTICEDLDSANDSSGCLSTIRAQHQNNDDGVMAQIRRERDRLRTYETEMRTHVDQLLQVQKDINTKADNFTRMILKKHEDCLTRLERDKKYLLEQMESQTNEYLSENATKLEEAKRYLDKITDREKNLDEIINKGSIDAKDEFTKSLLLHIHIQRPIPSLANATFHESSSWSGNDNILGRFEGFVNSSETQTEPTLNSYMTFLWNVNSLAKDAREIHWKLTIPNKILLNNLYDLKILQGVQNELKLRGDERKWDEIQAKHVRIVSLLNEVTRPTSDSSSEKLESQLNELQRNIGKLWNIIEFQFHCKNSEKGLTPGGFRNHGNTCYLNSVLQGLLQTVLLPFELTVNIYGLENVLKENKEMYHLSRAFMDLSSNYNEPEQRQISLRTLYTKFKESTQRFNDQEQHDSHDLLIHFLDKLRVEERDAWKIPSTGPEIQKLPTAVDKIFGGQFITVYTCHDCEEPYAIREPFLDISIPLCTFMPDGQKPEDNKSKPTIPSASEIYVRPIFNANVEQTTPGTSDDESESPSSSEKGISSSSAIDTKKDSSTREIREVVKSMLQPINVETSAEPGTKRFLPRFLTSNLTVSQCLKYFTRAEVINGEYLCRNCQTPESADLNMTSATKRTLISSPPAVLVLHLKRFEQKSTAFVKRDEMISYDELLDLGPFCSSSALRIDPEEENVWYSLYAVVIHRGFFLSQGHYVAYVKQRDSSAQLEDQLRERFLQKNFGDREKVPNDDDLAALAKRKAIGKRVKVKRPIPIPGQWFFISDDTVRPCEAKVALDQKAFLLFYERITGADQKTTGV